jgi:hypothetical protein
VAFALAFGDFFLFWPFMNHYSRNEPVEKFFPNLALLSRANPYGATYEGVAPIKLMRLGVLMHERWPTWRGVGWDD